MKTLKNKLESIYLKINDLEIKKEKISELECNIFDRQGMYNFDVLGEYLQETKEYNTNAAALKRMIQSLLDYYYCDKINWLKGKELHVYINAINKINH